jgi:hypothetical protein
MCELLFIGVKNEPTIKCVNNFMDIPRMSIDISTSQHSFNVLTGQFLY